MTGPAQFGLFIIRLIYLAYLFILIYISLFIYLYLYILIYIYLFIYIVYFYLNLIYSEGNPGERAQSELIPLLPFRPGGVFNHPVAFLDYQ